MGVELRPVSSVLHTVAQSMGEV